MTATLFHGGRIHVGDGRGADALLAQDGRVVEVGRHADVARRARGAERIDLRGGLMVPGWFDAHVHFMWWSLQTSRLDLREARSLDEALMRIDAYARTLPEGRWVLGGRFEKDVWGRWPTAAELDRVTAGHPAALRSKDGHSRWLNTTALEIAGIRPDMASPAGGAIERDDRGVPTGILKENANWLVDQVIPPPAADDCLAAIRAGQREAWRRGLTGLQSLEEAASFSAFQRLRESGELGLRVVMGIPHGGLDAAIALGTRTGLGDDWIRVGQLKIFSDGALGSQTAALEEPYEGTDDRGILTIEPERLAADVSRAAAAGIAVAIHAIGDRAVHAALDAIAPTRRTAPALRQRLEHIQLVREDDLGRFGELGIIASMQPIHAPSDRDLADRYWGPRRTPRSYPWRTLASRGAVLAFGSDAPVEPIDPLLGIHAAVARMRPRDAAPWHPEQALTLDEALGAYSAGGAYATGRERDFGSLAEGKRCDATVVEADLATLPPAEWPDLGIRATVVDGVVRHEDGLA